MLATGLLILKIIGLILLGILGLILALILIVLLVPVRYLAEVSYYDEVKAKASVSWLLHIISCKLVYDGELDMGIRIFGFRVGEKGDARKAADEESVRADAGTIREPAGADTENAAERETRVEGPKSEGAAGQQENLEAEILKELEEERQAELHAERKSSKRTASGAKVKRNPRFEMPFSFQGISDKLKEIGQKKDRVEELLKNEANQKTFALLIRQLKALLRHILPGKLRGKVKFGFDDPYTTGQVLMYISPFYGLYGKRFQIIPVFEEPVLEGEAWLKGRIRIGTILVLGIRIFLDRNFRILLKKSRK